MKTIEIIFEPTGKIAVPDPGELFYQTDNDCVEIADSAFSYAPSLIYRRVKRVTEWVPTGNEAFYVPAITPAGDACYNKWFFYNGFSCNPTFLFPTPELATAQAQKWIDAAKEESK